jgi:DNA-binding CsgD family transcriptional regulator
MPAHGHARDDATGRRGREVRPRTDLATQQQLADALRHAAVLLGSDTTAQVTALPNVTEPVEAAYELVTRELRTGPVRHLGDRSASAVYEELLEIHRQLVDERLLYRIDSWRRITESIDRLRGHESYTELLDAMGPELSACLGFDRFTVTTIHDADLLAVASYWPDDPDRGAELKQRLLHDPPQLAPRLIEADVVRRGRPRLVAGPALLRTSLSARQVTRSQAFLVAPLHVEERTVALAFTDCDIQQRYIDTIDLEGFTAFSREAAHLIERLAMRDQMRVQGQLLAGLAAGAGGPFHGIASPTAEVRAALLRDGSWWAEPLTRREIEVLGFMADGATNADIARRLHVTEAAVKFHVTNILRKIPARNRAEAVARYLRATRGHETRTAPL